MTQCGEQPELSQKFLPVSVFLTRFFNEVEDGFSADVFIVLEMINAVVLVFVAAVHRTLLMKCCEERERNWGWGGWVW